MILYNGCGEETNTLVRAHIDKFYLQVEEFNCCDCNGDYYTVALVVDEETVGHVPRDVPKLENYDEIKSRVYKLSFNKLLEADNSFLEKNIYFGEVRVLNFWDIYGIFCFMPPM